jgi:signal transduction histidine kinase
VISRQVIALGRGTALFGLSAAGLVAFVLHLLVIPAPWGWGVPPVVVGSRRLTNRYRRLARRWCGVEIAEPYAPAPGSSEPRPGAGRERPACGDGGPVERARQVEWVLKDPATWRDMTWMLTAALVATPLVLPFVLIGSGVAVLIRQPLIGMALAMAGLLVGLLAASPLLRLHVSWSRLLLAPTERARLAQRVHRLTETRAHVAETQAAELRRIERDLHDGAQAKLVAMGMTLGAIERHVADNPAARELLARTRDTAARALQELRDLVRGIHPPVLAERGLGDAVRALALDSTVPVLVTIDLPGQPEPPVESAAYFAVAEALTNAVKHARAERVRIDVRHQGGALFVTVTDDGRGGATVTTGGGLSGIQRRLGTFDGVLTLESPAGGPTTVTMEVPCVLSSRRTSTFSGTV